MLSMRVPGGSADAGLLPSRRASCSRDWATVFATRSPAFSTVFFGASMPSVVSFDSARSSGASGLSGADSTRDICTDCATSVMGSRRMSAMKASQVFA